MFYYAADKFAVFAAKQVELTVLLAISESIYDMWLNAGTQNCFCMRVLLWVSERKNARGEIRTTQTSIAYKRLNKASACRSQGDKNKHKN